MALWKFDPSIVDDRITTGDAVTVGADEFHRGRVPTGKKPLLYASFVHSPEIAFACRALTEIGGTIGPLVTRIRGAILRQR